nr:hypothetical protein [Tanacetum cinerariifolium]
YHLTCHLLIRPAASRRHVAASYWTAASDAAATSAPVNAAGHAAGHRSTTTDHDGDRRSTVAVNDCNAPLRKEDVMS